MFQFEQGQSSVPLGSMLTLLHEAEAELPQLLRDESVWHSIRIDVTLPIIRRLWMPWREGRLHLHRIDPFDGPAELFHPHAWPSGMRILSGQYEMRLGYGPGEMLPDETSADTPPVSTTVILVAGSAYEMTHRDAWHTVQPTGTESAYTIMVTGPPWPNKRSAPKTKQQLGPLPPDESADLFAFFRSKYPA